MPTTVPSRNPPVNSAIDYPITRLPGYPIVVREVSLCLW
jgi:hypothetical protein